MDKVGISADGAGRRLRWWVLIAVGLSSTAGGLAAMMFAPLIGEVAQDIGVSVGVASFAILGLPAFVSALGMAIVGFLIDRLGVFKVMMAGQGLLVLSFAAMPLAGHDLYLIAFLRFFHGAGAACLSAVTMPTLARWFGRHEIGRAMGLQAIGIPVGLMLALNGAPLLSHVLGSWKLGVALLAVVPAIAFVVTLTVAVAASSRKLSSGLMHSLGAMPFPTTGATSFIRIPVFWVGLILVALVFAVSLAFTSLAPGYLAVNPPVGAGYGSQAAGGLVFVHALAGMAGPPLSGWVLDKVLGGRSRLLVSLGWVLSAVFYTAIIVPAVVDNKAVLTAVLLIAGFANPFINITVMSFATKAFPAEILGRVSGLWLSVGSLAGSAGVMIGALALQATGSYHLPFLMIGVGSVLGLVFAQYLKVPQVSSNK